MVSGELDQTIEQVQRLTGFAATYRLACSDSTALEIQLTYRSPDLASLIFSSEDESYELLVDGSLLTQIQRDQEGGTYGKVDCLLRQSSEYQAFLHAVELICGTRNAPLGFGGPSFQIEVSEPTAGDRASLEVGLVYEAERHSPLDWLTSAARAPECVRMTDDEAIFSPTPYATFRISRANGFILSAAVGNDRDVFCDLELVKLELDPTLDCEFFNRSMEESLLIDVSGRLNSKMALQSFLAQKSRLFRAIQRIDTSESELWQAVSGALRMYHEATLGILCQDWSSGLQQRMEEYRAALQSQYDDAANGGPRLECCVRDGARVAENKFEDEMTENLATYLQSLYASSRNTNQARMSTDAMRRDNQIAEHVFDALFREPLRRQWAQSIAQLVKEKRAEFAARSKP